VFPILDTTSSKHYHVGGIQSERKHSLVIEHAKADQALAAIITQLEQEKSDRTAEDEFSQAFQQIRNNNNSRIGRRRGKRGPNPPAPQNAHATANSGTARPEQAFSNPPAPQNTKQVTFPTWAQACARPQQAQPRLQNPPLTSQQWTEPLYPPYFQPQTTTKGHLVHPYARYSIPRPTVPVISNSPGWGYGNSLTNPPAPKENPRGYNTSLKNTEVPRAIPHNNQHVNNRQPSLVVFRSSLLESSKATASPNLSQPSTRRDKVTSLAFLSSRGPARRLPSAADSFCYDISASGSTSSKVPRKEVGQKTRAGRFKGGIRSTHSRPP
jgi:hypothetical protein